MGAKKKPEGKKKGGDDDGDNPAEVSSEAFKLTTIILTWLFLFVQVGAILEAEVDGLRTMLVLEQERCDKARRVVNEVVHDGKILRDDLIKQEKDTAECVRLMNEQYSNMEKRLMDNIDDLTETVNNQENETKDLNEDIARLMEEKERKDIEMNNQIDRLNLKINEMATEFAEMLKDTLKKMEDRVEFANKDYSDADIGGELAGQFGNAHI